ncbi:MAG: hypothetical protein IKL49_05885 [Lachnospiraceae bacterium]|nr:hypothetical protein [Lachnospiraceae bacterium]
MTNMIVGTSILILVILLIRRIFWKKCSPNVIYFLWIFVAFRILLPVNIPLEISGYPLAKTFVMDFDIESGPEEGYSGEEDVVISKEAEENTQVEDREEIKEHTGNEFQVISNESNKNNIELPSQEITSNQSGVSFFAKFITVMKNIVHKQAVFLATWFTGSLFFALYFFIVNRNLFKGIEKKKIGIEGNIEVFEVQGYNCLYGIRKSRIFLSPEIANNPVYKKYVVMHELEHHRTKDNFWLLMRTVCVTVQWFNPLVWIAYFKMREDCELACDYRVLSKLKKEERSIYGKALLHILETNQKTVSMASSMGREKNLIKKRIKSIFKKRKAEAYLVPFAVTCIVTILAFVQPTIAQEIPQKVNGAELANQEVAGIGAKIEQAQKENNSDMLTSDFVEEAIEKEYEILVENKKDLERGINLHYSNCYITDMKRGSNHYWIDEDGVLWGEGTSEYGQLGIIKKDVSVVGEPVKIAENVIHVDFSGEYFVIYLTKDHELYGLGASPAGILTQFGSWNFNVIDLEMITEPVLLMKNVVYARAGETSIITLLENGDVYVLGNNDHVMISNTKYIAPQKVMEKAKYVTLFYHSYAAIDENNDLWTWGHNELGQCGIGVYSSNVPSPQKIMEDVECVWMGGIGFNTTDVVKKYDNLVVLKKDGSFLACGEGIGESRLVNRVDDQVYENVEIISTEYLRQVKIKEYNRTSLKEVQLLWSEKELKEFLESNGIDYGVVYTGEEAYLTYMTKPEKWEFVFNEKGELAKIIMEQ